MIIYMCESPVNKRSIPILFLLLSQRPLITLLNILSTLIVLQRVYHIEINHQEVHLHPLMEEVDHHQDMGLLAMTPGQGEDISQEGFPINIRLTQELEEDL